MTDLQVAGNAPEIIHSFHWRYSWSGLYSPSQRITTRESRCGWRNLQASLVSKIIQKLCQLSWFIKGIVDCFKFSWSMSPRRIKKIICLAREGIYWQRDIRAFVILAKHAQNIPDNQPSVVDNNKNELYTSHSIPHLKISLLIRNATPSLGKGEWKKVNASTLMMIAYCLN